EALPAHHGELGARFRLPRRSLRPGLGKFQQCRSSQRACSSKRGATLKQRAASKVMHSPSSVEFDYFFGRSVFSGVEALSRGLVEKMDERRIRLQPDLVAWIELMTLAEHRDDLFTAELGEDLGF